MLAATLFSGIGAPEEAMPYWDWRWCAEIDKFACAVLAQRHPDSVNLGDVAAHDFTERAAAIAKPDVIVFGSPCQSFSVAGQRLGLDDPRGNLALVALGIVDRLKPRWFVFENVPGLMSSAGGSDFGLFLRTVDELGYCCAWSVLDAQFFGVAQRRERVFVVGHLGADWRRPAAVLLEPEGVRGHHPPRRTQGERTAGTIKRSLERCSADEAECGGLITAQDAPDIAWALQERDAKGADSDTKKGHLIVADPITASFAKHHGKSGGKDSLPRNHIVATSLRASQGGGDKAHVMTVALDLRNALRDPDKKDEMNRQGCGIGDDVAHTLSSSFEPGVAYSIMPQNSGKDYKARPVEVAQPLMAGGPTTGNQGGDFIASSAVRRLLPVECEKLQGFCRDYTLITYRGKPAADGPRYRALGNSMAVPVVRWILQRIEHLERDQ